MAKGSAAAKVKEEAVPVVPRVVGKVVSKELSAVKPNMWNPNQMTPWLKESLKHGLKTDGWLSSQALLIWGTDEKGRAKNIIIDGEHRWTVGNELGFKKGPMVFLDRLTEVQAKALTVKMNQKRGEFEPKKLSEVLREIQYVLGADDFSIEMGIEQSEMMPLLAEPEIIMGGSEIEPTPRNAPEGGDAGIPSSNVRMVQLFLNHETHAEFTENIRQLSKKYGTSNVTDTTLEAIRRACNSSSNKG